MAESRRAEQPRVAPRRSQQSIRISQRGAISTPLVNPSALGGNERIGLYTTFLVDGTLFYCLTIVPGEGRRGVPGCVSGIAQSIRLTETR